MSKRVGLTCGVFDLFHAGHVIMLQECKEHCDHLVVAINKAENIDSRINPGKQPPVFPYEQRKLIMEHCDLVDEVIGYNSEEELLEILAQYKPQVRFLGDDYKGRPITGGELSEEVYYTNRDHGLSTSRFKKAIADLMKSTS